MQHHCIKTVQCDSFLTLVVLSLFWERSYGLDGIIEFTFQLSESYSLVFVNGDLLGHIAKLAINLIIIKSKRANKAKATYDILCIKIYHKIICKCICINKSKNYKHIVHYIKLQNIRIVKLDFQNVDWHIGAKWLTHATPNHTDNQCETYYGISTRLINEWFSFFSHNILIGYTRPAHGYHALLRYTGWVYHWWWPLGLNQSC